MSPIRFISMIIFVPMITRACTPTSMSAAPPHAHQKCCAHLRHRHASDHSDHHHSDHFVRGQLRLDYSAKKCPQKMVATCSDPSSDHHHYHHHYEVALVGNGQFFLAVKVDNVSREARCGPNGHWQIMGGEDGKQQQLELHRLECIVAKRQKECKKESGCKKKCDKCAESGSGSDKIIEVIEFVADDRTSPSEDSPRNADF